MTIKLPIYLDHHATTPLDPRVLEAMLPYFTEKFGNASSKTHTFGQEAAVAVEKAREQVASAIGGKSKEIIFTSGATESINLAIKGVSAAYTEKGNHFITAATEHRAVLDCLECLASDGDATVTVLPVDRQGMISADAIAGAIRKETVMVLIMTANNEIGTINPVREIGRVCRENDILFFTDATQAVGKIPLDVNKDNIDLLACSAHKVYGPKGVGALFVRHRTPRIHLTPQMDGGGHEKGVRSGTLNVPGIVGFGAALELSKKIITQESQRIRELRDRLEQGLLEAIPEASINGAIHNRLPGNISLTIPRVESEALLIALRDEVALSTGSACTTEKVEPSHVLQAIGLSPDKTYSTIRLGLGRFTHEEETNYILTRIVGESDRLRKLQESMICSDR